eukprot:219099-Prymnesium_polylepis.1
MLHAAAAAACSMQLPLVLGTGMGSTYSERETSYRGMAAVSAAHFGSCLRRVLASLGVCVGAQLPKERRHLEASLPMPSERRYCEVTEEAICRAHARRSGSGLLVEGLTGLPTAEQQSAAEDMVMQAAEALASGRAVIEADTALMEAGIDSLAATELAAQLQGLTSNPLSPTLIFEHPTPRSIVAHLMKHEAGEEPMTAAQAAGGGGRSLAVLAARLFARWEVSQPAPLPCCLARHVSFAAGR